MLIKEILTESRQVSPELTKWVYTWVTSSYKIQDQIQAFKEIEEEASYMLNISYPKLYRGLSITEDDLKQLKLGQSISINSHMLQSWTKSKAIAMDYALPCYGGNIGILVGKTDTQIKPVMDVTNVLKRVGRKNWDKSTLTDAAREKEVVVYTGGKLIINPKDVLKII